MTSPVYITMLLGYNLKKLVKVVEMIQFNIFNIWCTQELIPRDGGGGGVPRKLKKEYNPASNLIMVLLFFSFQLNNHNIVTVNIT